MNEQYELNNKLVEYFYSKLDKLTRELRVECNKITNHETCVAEDPDFKQTLQKHEYLNDEIMQITLFMQELRNFSKGK